MQHHHVVSRRVQPRVHRFANAADLLQCRCMQVRPPKIQHLGKEWGAGDNQESKPHHFCLCSPQLMPLPGSPPALLLPRPCPELGSHIPTPQHPSQQLRGPHIPRDGDDSPSMILQGTQGSTSKRCQLGLMGEALVFFSGLSLPCPSSCLVRQEGGCSCPGTLHWGAVPAALPLPQSPLLPAVTHLGVKFADIMSPFRQIEKLRGRQKKE